MNINWI